MEIFIHADIESVWRLTQTPDLHARWDFRFSEIQYLPRPDPNQPQQFLYATRIGMGLKIQGCGETVGERTSGSGNRSSSLKFWSDDPKSLIAEGSGCWKYCPVDGGVRFLTLYDYRVRFGWLGRIVDQIFFRPLLGWATAWSFDRLRLWSETGMPPEASLRFAVICTLARLTVAFVWLWHALVPKLLFNHPDESVMLIDAGWSAGAAQAGVTVAAACEVLLALWTLLHWRSALPLLATIVLMAIALAGVAVASPRMLAAPFNPVTLNVLFSVVAGIAWAARPFCPAAAHCRRRKSPS